jgi:hypothetical protein
MKNTGAFVFVCFMLAGSAHSANETIQFENRNDLPASILVMHYYVDDSKIPISGPSEISFTDYLAGVVYGEIGAYFDEGDPLYDAAIKSAIIAAMNKFYQEHPENIIATELTKTLKKRGQACKLTK